MKLAVKSQFFLKKTNLKLNKNDILFSDRWVTFEDSFFNRFFYIFKNESWIFDDFLQICDFLEEIGHKNQNMKLILNELPNELRRFFYLFFLRKKKIFHLKNKQRSFWFLKNTNVENKFLNIFFKGGSKIKYMNIYGDIFYHFFNKFTIFRHDVSSLYYIYEILYNLSRTNKNFWTQRFIFELFELYLYSLFSVSIFKQPKYIRKKTKEKYALKYVYLPLKKRLRDILRQIVNYSSFFHYYDFSLRLYHAFWETVMMWKDSFLYKQKITTCKNVLKLLKAR